MVITEKNSTGTRRTTESFQWPIRHAISLFFLKKIEGNRQALTSVIQVLETMIATPAHFLHSLPNLKYWKKSKNKRMSLSRIWHLTSGSHLWNFILWLLQIFFHSSCLKMALNVFQQMLFLRERGVNFYDPFSFLKALSVDKRFPIQKLPPCKFTVGP